MSNQKKEKKVYRKLKHKQQKCKTIQMNMDVFTQKQMSFEEMSQLNSHNKYKQFKDKTYEEKSKGYLKSMLIAVKDYLYKKLFRIKQIDEEIQKQKQRHQLKAENRTSNEYYKPYEIIKKDQQKSIEIKQFFSGLNKFYLVSQIDSIPYSQSIIIDQKENILINGNYSQIQIWNVNQWQLPILKQTLVGHTDSISCLCFSNKEQFFFLRKQRYHYQTLGKIIKG